MAHRNLVVALSMIVAAAPLSAAQPDAGIGVAPAGTPDTQYCLRVGPVTGSLAETIQCWTRDEWAEQGVNVDKEWAKEGVSIKG